MILVYVRRPLLHEGLGSSWRGGADAIPVTECDVEIGSLDVSDPNHPRLRTPHYDLESSNSKPTSLARNHDFVSMVVPDSQEALLVLGREEDQGSFCRPGCGRMW